MDLDAFRAAGYDVYGLSSDAPRVQRWWAERLSLRYTLLSDAGREVIGARTGTRTRTSRSHFVVRGGCLALASVGVKVGARAAEARAFVQAT